MQRRMFSFAIIGFLAFGLAACSGSGNDQAIREALDSFQRVADTINKELEAARRKLGETTPGRRPVSITEWLDNPTAEDLLDHWNEPQVLRTALNLSTASETEIADSKATIRRLIVGAGGDQSKSKLNLRHVSPDDIEIIGLLPPSPCDDTADCVPDYPITFGRWTAGPAGTLNIEFDWRFAPNVAPTVRAAIERAGKSWSRRLLDDFGTHVTMEGMTILARGEHSGAAAITGTFGEDVVTDGLLVATFHSTSDYLSSAGPWRADITATDYEPWLGLITLAQHTIDGKSTLGNYWLTHAAAHEIGHILGVTNHEGGWNVPTYERYVNRVNYTFEGPQSQAANGGQAVPFQWLDAERNEVPPNTPGAYVDFGHLGVCSSLMAYCNEPREVYEPSEIDFAFLSDIGYEILDADTASEPEVYGYGAWGRYSAWSAGVQRLLNYEEAENDIYTRDLLRAGADAFGSTPEIPFFQFVHEAESIAGSFTWQGRLIGVDLGDAKLPPVLGDAELKLDSGHLNGTARFSQLTVHAGGSARTFRSPELSYSIYVTEDGFFDRDGRIGGSFFGPTYQEIAGVLNDRAPDVGLLAGFGGKQ